jgi:hypothetical protein
MEDLPNEATTGIAGDVTVSLYGIMTLRAGTTRPSIAWKFNIYAKKVSHPAFKFSRHANFADHHIRRDTYATAARSP